MFPVAETPTVIERVIPGRGATVGRRIVENTNETGMLNMDGQDGFD